MAVFFAQCVCVTARVMARRIDARHFGVVTPSGGAERTLQIEVSQFELDLVGAARGDREVDASHAGAHLSAELQEPETNGLRRGIGELGKAQTDTA